MSAESNIVYRKDISNSSIKLLFRTRAAEGCCRHHHRRRRRGGGATPPPPPPQGPGTPPDADVGVSRATLPLPPPPPMWAAPRRRSNSATTASARASASVAAAEVGGGCATLPSPPPPDQDLRLHHCRRHSLRWRSLLRLRPQPSWAAAARLHHQHLRQGPGGCDSTATSGGGDGDCSVGKRLLSVLNIKLPCNPRLVCRCIPICRTDSRISNVQA